MMKRFLCALALAVTMAVTLSAAAGSVTTTSATVGGNKGINTVTKYTIAWTSDASGNVNGNSSTVRVGKLFKVEIIPGTAGVQPTDLYDVTLTDSNSVDLLNASGADQSQTTSKVFQFSPEMFVDDTALTLTVANAGNAKSGTVILWVQ